MGKKSIDTKHKYIIASLLIVGLIRAVYLYQDGEVEQDISPTIVPSPYPTVNLEIDDSNKDHSEEIPGFKLYPDSELEDSFKRIENDKVGYSMEFEHEGGDGDTVYAISNWYIDYFENKEEIEITRYPDELRENETEVFIVTKVGEVQVNYTIESHFDSDEVEIIVEVPLQDLSSF